MNLFFYSNFREHNEIKAFLSVLCHSTVSSFMIMLLFAFISVISNLNDFLIDFDDLVNLYFFTEPAISFFLNLF